MSKSHYLSAWIQECWVPIVLNDEHSELDLDELPDFPSLFCLFAQDDDEKILIYCGKTEQSLRSYWESHRFPPFIELLKRSTITLTIAWLALPLVEGWLTPDIFDSYHQDLIAHLNPVLQHLPMNPVPEVEVQSETELKDDNNEANNLLRLTI